MSLEWDIELHPRRSPASGTSTLAKRTEQLTLRTNPVGAQQCWADHLQLDQKSPLADMPIISETMTSSRLKDSMVLMIEEKIIQNKPKFDQESQDHHPLKPSVSLVSLDPKITDLTRTMSLQMGSVLSPHVPLLSPEVCRLLELHVKKLIHFQKWGLPRRVEESLRQLMPDPTLFCRSRKNPLSSILNSGSEVTMDKNGTIPHQTNGLYLTNQPTQSCWVSKWSVINVRQRTRWHQIRTYLPSREVEHLSGLYPPSKAQANDSGSNLQSEYYSQLFCGLPSLHSESLGVASLSSQGVSKPSSTDPQPTREISLSVLPKSPWKPAPLSSPGSPNAKHPPEHEKARISVPLLTLAECEALECHLLERQVKIQWGLPAVYLRNRYTQGYMLHEQHGKAKAIKTSWPRKPFLHPTREFLPDHSRRLLEFHLQKQLIYLRWGLPQRIQRSVHLLFSSADQQSRSYGSRALPNVSTPQPGNPEADGSGDMFAPTVDKGPNPMPHLFTRAKAMLKSHVDFKCDQIHQGKVPTQVWSSWESRIPGSLSTTAPCSWIPQGQHLGLQAERKSNSDLHHRIVPWKPVKPATLSQEKQAISGALIEHCKRPQSLSEETIKKLETTLQHKYLAFLSGLPALYCVALSRPTSPAVTSQPRITEMKSRPVKSPSEALTQMTSPKGPLEPCAWDDNEVSEDTLGDFQPESQVQGRPAKGPLKNATLDSPNSLNTHSLAKLNFHLKRKVLAMQFGISGKEREFKELAVANPETESIQEFLKSLGIPKSTALQKLPSSGDSPPAPDANRAHLQKQPDTAVQTVGHREKQPSAKAVPHHSVQYASKASQVEPQVLCVQMETTGGKPSLEEPFNAEPQSPSKSKYSTHVPTLTEKSKEPEKPKAVGDLGEGDAVHGLPPTSEETHYVGDQEPEKRPLCRTPQGSSQQRHSFPLEDPSPPSPQDSPEPEFPDPPPEDFMKREPEHDMQHSQTKVNVILKPARIAEVPQLVAPKASQDLPFPRPPIQGKPFRGQTWQDHTSRRRVMPTSPRASPSLPDAGLKNKMKSFLHSINPKIKGKIHTEPMVTTPGKVPRTSKGNVDKGLSQAKSPTKKTKTENFRGPKAQPASSENSVIASFLTAPHLLDSKLRPRSRQYGAVSVPGQPRHCPRHCPRLAYATQYRNPP
ncbi:hypothetical protein HispidOSU_008571 [Sigmodon hispidus]